jgi:hypothetical protein
VNEERIENRWTVTNIPKLIVALAVTAYFLYYSQTSGDWHFLDNVNLIIHEAGHPLFSFFGRFMHILGGSLLQVAIPVVFAGYFFFQRQYFSSSLVLFWVGQNIINVSVYAADAQKMALPLLGGDTAGHDWHNMLSMHGLLSYTDIIAQLIYYLGFICILGAGILAVITSQWESRGSNI